MLSDVLKRWLFVDLIAPDAVWSGGLGRAQYHELLKPNWKFDQPMVLGMTLNCFLSLLHKSCMLCQMYAAWATSIVAIPHPAHRAPSTHINGKPEWTTASTVLKEHTPITLVPPPHRIAKVNSNHFHLLSSTSVFNWSCTVWYVVWCCVVVVRQGMKLRHYFRREMSSSKA